MGVYSAAKFAIVAILGLAGTIYGWHFAHATGVIFNGFSIGAPVGLILGSYLVASAYLGWRWSIARILAVVGVACLTAGVNTAALRFVYPHAPFVNQLDESETGDFQPTAN